MANYDFGGGCSCGLQKVCDCYHSLPKLERIILEINKMQMDLKNLKKLRKQLEKEAIGPTVNS